MTDAHAISQRAAATRSTATRPRTGRRCSRCSASPAALQFSIAAAQILLAIALICWLALLVVRRERFEAPRFFWPLLAYARLTLVSAAFSPEPRASLIDCKQLVLFLLVPLVYRFVTGSRAAHADHASSSPARRSARRSASSSTASSTTTTSASGRRARSATT